MYTSLYVIGNGFDLHHNLNSSYSNFADYVKENYAELYDTIINILEIHHTPDNDREWGLLEECLGRVSANAVLERLSGFIESPDSDDYFKGFTSLDIEEEKLFMQLQHGIKETLYQWLTTIFIHQNQASNKLRLNDNSCYLSFNYTKTLSKIYGVSDSDVCFIHGSVEDENSIIFGHSDAHIELLEEAFEYDEDGICGDAYYPLSRESINSKLENYFHDSLKPVDEIASENAEFFIMLANVQNVYILGHSLSDVDIGYFKLIKNSISSTAFWTVSFHTNHEEGKHKETLLNLGIDCVRTIRLSDLKN